MSLPSHSHITSKNWFEKKTGLLNSAKITLFAQDSNRHKNKKIQDNDSSLSLNTFQGKKVLKIGPL